MVRRIAAGLAILVAVLAALYLWYYNPLGMGLPKDSELTALFRAHRESFEKLRSMAMADTGSLFLISEDALKRDASLSAARRDEYLRLMAFDKKMTIGVTNKGVTFRFAGGGVGLAIARTWIKGIDYLPPEATKGYVMRESLDGLGRRDDGVYLAPIEGNWYLVYSNLD